jgi:hypothetical protein
MAFEDIKYSAMHIEGRGRRRAYEREHTGGVRRPFITADEARGVQSNVTTVDEYRPFLYPYVCERERVCECVCVCACVCVRVCVERV